MTATAYPYYWGLEEFLRAWEAGAFDKRAELIDGEVWSVPIGPWHGETTMRVARALPNGRFRITAASLPAGDSLPDPDCWVLRTGAEPIAQLSQRMPRWDPTDVLLIVEVSDETLDHDLGRKAALYARCGYPRYWSVTRDGVYDHSDPGPTGYRRRSLHGPGEQITVPYVEDVSLTVDDLLAPT
ncbi:MAG: Uma2 family endonuclease [Pseudonocardia sp.]